MTLARAVARAWAASTPLAACLAPAGAQQPDSLPPRDSAFLVEPVVVTVSRLPLSGGTAGLALSVIDGQELAARAIGGAVDVVRGQPGVFVDESVGPGGPTIVRIRGGEEVFTQILVDGVQVNQNGGFFNLLGFRLSNLDRVEIARGPQSAVYGSSAVSGLVHFITPRGAPGPPRVTTRIEAGGATEHGGRWLAESTVRGGSDRVRYSLGAGASSNRGIWAVPNDTRTRDGSMRLDWAAAPGWETTLTGRVVATRSKLPVRDAGATRVPLDPNARDSFDRTVLSLRLRNAPSSRWEQSVRVSHYRESFVFEDERDGIESPGEFFVFDANLRFQADLRRTTATYHGSARASPHVELAWGGQWEREELANLITGDFSDDLALDRTSGALFAEAALRPAADLVVLGGVRAERFEGLAWELTPRLSAALTLAEGRWAVRSAVGSAYKAPNLQQQFVDNPFIVANPDLRPETSLSAELGADWVGVDGRVAASLTAFRQTFDDLIRTVLDEGAQRQINRNLGAARARGVEWELTVHAADAWTLGTDGSRIETEVSDNQGLVATEYPEGEALPFRPDYTASGYAQWSPNPRLRVRARMSWIGGQEVLSERFSGRREALAAYRLVGLNASLQATPQARVYLRVDNLLDRDYFTAFDRPGSPASGAVGFELTF